jgi:hypothetical protein
LGYESLTLFDNFLLNEQEICTGKSNLWCLKPQMVEWREPTVRAVLKHLRNNFSKNPDGEDMRKWNPIVKEWIPCDAHAEIKSELVSVYDGMVEPELSAAAEELYRRLLL